MFKIDKDGNRIQKISPRSFSELGFRERAHLQEWIANQPDSLGEDLLIIQKEFAGFSDTQERLDLLAIDKQGSLVVIENKLDDTGRDVTWQALKYASYCARLTTDDIRDIFQSYLDRNVPGANAEEQLCTFLEEDEYQDVILNKGVTQRVMLVAANFRKEVTSTVLWLSSFKLRIQCFKISPFSQGDDLFLTIDQIIPTKDAEDFMIGLATKAQTEVEGVEAEKTRHTLRLEFWSRLLTAMNAKSQLLRNISPRRDNWLGTGSGTRGISFNLVVTGEAVRSEVYIDTGASDLNETIFNALCTDANAIETEFGEALVWERLEGRRACRIKAEREGNIFDRERWPGMIDYMVEATIKLDKTFRMRVAEVSRTIGRSSAVPG
ncbi:hypothetical protein ASE23_20215 [Rhizobium sp. Root73]|uniref:DUF4268 domain-containing protein n=1 Tax=unclassified Rhizobium TaxID=2613769 RepID=UPI00072C1765|nr:MULTISPECIES: DUF4268 domain-containing protein [unclassified Rhizobium]KQY16311.1 hypothetical protein ASD36_22890 [Rhizobium sp. Root1334]KRC12690.1 hypothetical protein ASE23_20215 [Rhizobium sp. Root73]